MDSGATPLHISWLNDLISGDIKCQAIRHTLHVFGRVNIAKDSWSLKQQLKVH